MADYACGTVFKYGDNIDTDVIIPARYLNITDMNQLSAHCMEDLDRSFIRNVRKNDIIVGGLNFGCGLRESMRLRSFRRAAFVW